MADKKQKQTNTKNDAGMQYRATKITNDKQIGAFGKAFGKDKMENLRPTE